MRRLRILTVLDYYLPAFKAGGPVRSIRDLVSHLGDGFQFDILTGDRDLGDDRPFAGVRTGQWQAVNEARVQYLAPRQRTFLGWAAVLRGVEADVIYVNSLFSRHSMKIVLLRRLGLVPRVPIILAPRGELHPGALSLHRRRKAAWLFASRRLGLAGDICWQAATAEERADILRVFPPRRGSAAPVVHVVPELPVASCPEYERDAGRDKRPGYARVVFVSRMLSKKNLDYALRVLRHVRGRVEFDIYGPIEDARYWRECGELIEQLPASVSACYRGTVAPRDVAATFARYHLFLFPTRGESFGWVVLESLLAGCPAMISDQTPWRVASGGAGWEAPLDQPQLFAAHLDTLLGMDAPSFARLSRDARAFGLSSATDEDALDANRRLFLEAAASGSRG